MTARWPVDKVPGLGRRAVKKGRPRIEDRARTIEARKPWLKLGMSRRAWYRRQAEKRKGQGADRTADGRAHVTISPATRS
jgi:hypothetical protein